MTKWEEPSVIGVVEYAQEAKDEKVGEINSQHNLHIIEKIQEMQRLADALRKEGRRIGLVPTMGGLHEGHLSLVRRARDLSDVVVVSVFVNPMQFGAGEDLETYPRDLERDLRSIEEAGGEVVFMPSVEEMYPEGSATYVEVEGLTSRLCGAFRPGHFRGVTTVVTKLFCAVKPHIAVFGQKDAQQAIVIRRMTQDLNVDVAISVAPTVREPDGLAMSSRNAYLSPEEREDAGVLFRSLERAREMIEGGERRADRVVRSMNALISSCPHAKVEYVEAVDAERLEPMEMLCGKVLIALAVRIGCTRLIDNLAIEV